MKNNKFLSSIKTMPIAKNWRYWIIAPVVIIITALILVIALGATTGSYTDAVGIGIDFEGGTLVTVTIGQDAIDNYDHHVAQIKATIEKHGVKVGTPQLQKADNVNETAISFRYKNISTDDAEIAAEEIVNDIF